MKKQTEVSTKRPEALGAKVTINSKAKADAALAELAWIRARSKQIDGELDAEYSALKLKFEPQRDLTIGKSKTTLDERAELLDELLEAWAVDHLAELLPADSKTLKLTFGSISTKETPKAVDLLDEWNDERVLIAIDAETKFIAGVQAVEGTPFLGTLTVSDFVVVTATLNRSRILELLKSKELTDEVLAPFGLKLREPGEQISIKPKAA